MLESYEIVPPYKTPNVDPGSQFCDVCFGDMHDPVAQGMMLLPCRHFFCNECWKFYIVERIRIGCSKIQCQVLTILSTSFAFSIFC